MTEQAGSSVGRPWQRVDSRVQTLDTRPTLTQITWKAHPAHAPRRPVAPR